MSMKKLAISGAALLLGFSVMAVAATGATGDVPIIPLESQLAGIMARLDDEEAGLSVLVRRQDRVIFRQSRGLANRDKGIAIDGETGFRIGSISKTFTALAVMQLAERGRLDLDDSVRQYLPVLPRTWQPVTIRHLLSHRVALSDDLFDDANLTTADGATNRQLVEFVSRPQVEVTALAAEAAVYCNSCYVLLAEVVAEASGQGFAEYMKTAIFTPAGMQGSYIVEKGVSLRTRDALNYARTARFLGIIQYTSGAMAQVSSVEDFQRFIAVLKRGKLVSPATLKLMTEPHADLGEDGIYGLGWSVGPGLQPFFAHGGAQDGYQAELFFHPRHQLEVVILSNGGERTFAVQRALMRAILGHYRSQTGA